MAKKKSELKLQKMILLGEPKVSIKSTKTVGITINLLYIIIAE